MIRQENSSSTILDLLEVRINGASHGVYAKKKFLAGEIITSFDAKESFKTPNKYTLQVQENLHITLKPEILQYVNHSCNPTVFFNTQTMQIQCLRDIHANDEITFFYPSTEWEMDEKFICTCGSEKCLKEISGAKSINKTLTHSYQFNSHIITKLAEIP